MFEAACTPPALPQTLSRSQRAILAWGNLRRSIRSLPTVGTWLCIERYGSCEITGMYHGIDPHKWTLLMLTGPNDLDTGEVQRQAVEEEYVRGIAFKDIKRISVGGANTLTDVGSGSRPSSWQNCDETMSSIRWVLLEQQLRRLFQSQLTSSLRMALEIHDTWDLEYGFEGACCELEIEHAKARLQSLALCESARVPSMDLDCDSWLCVVKNLTVFEHVMLKSTCLYINALQYADADGRDDPERMLLRKAAYHVLDPTQNVDDLFVDMTVDVDALSPRGVPLVCITALHLAARIGDAAMCEVLLKRRADVNVNVRLLPVPDIAAWERRNGTSYDFEECLPYAHILEMNTVRIADKHEEGFKYDVDFGHVTPLRLAEHFGHHAVEALLRQHSGNRGHSPEGHFATLGRSGTYDAPIRAGRIGIRYVGTYEPPNGLPTCIRSCWFFCKPHKI